MSAIRKLALVVLLCVVVPLGLMAFIEGTASAGLLLSAARARTSPGNFRQAEYDSLLGWVSVHNMARKDNFGPGLTTTTNAMGLRIHSSDTVLAPGQKRMLCSGDSFTFGSGVADTDTFCAQLEHEIPSVRTVNLAQLGYGIDQAYLSYKRDGAKIPHQINLFAFIWHDFERMALTEFWGYPKPRLSLKDGGIVVGNVPVPQWSGPSRWTQGAAMLDQVRLVQFLRRRMDLSDSAKLARVDDQVWNIAEAVFIDLDKLNKANGSELVMVYLPAPPDLTAGAYDHRRERLAAFSKAHNLKFIDLTPEIRTLPSDTLDWMFITANALPVNGSSGHYTREGHTWVAKRLAEHLAALGVTPPVNAAAAAASPPVSAAATKH